MGSFRVLEPSVRPAWRLYLLCGFVDAILATMVLAAPERALMVMFAAVIFCAWLGIRLRPASPLGHIRAAATAALVAALILAATTGLSWVGTSPSASGQPLCLLGTEIDCARSLAGDFGALALDPRQALELARWHEIGVTARAGVWLILLLFVPAAVCLIVEPENRTGQAVAMMGGFLAAATGAAALAYRLMLPAWMGASASWASDVAVLAAGTLAWSAAIVAVCALSPAPRPGLPAARLLPTRSK